MIVDDDAVIREGIVRRLKRMDCREIGDIHAAESGERALEVLRAVPVDVLLTDIQMDGMNGLELIDCAYQMGSLASCIILTSYAEFRYAQKAIQLDVDSYLVKPCTEKDMRRAVTRVIEKRKQAAVAPEATLPSDTKHTHPMLWACQYIQQHLFDDIDMAVVSNELNMSYHYFSRQFKQKIGMTFMDYVNAQKMKEAAQMLKTGMRVSHIASKLGYMNSQNFARAFQTYFGCVPSKYWQRQEARHVQKY